VKTGDLVRVKEFYRGFHSPRTWGLVIGAFTDDDGSLWYRVSCPSHEPSWQPCYELELLCETNKQEENKK
jgi:hypothetical protein